jgi:hypothetical protein
MHSQAIGCRAIGGSRERFQGYGEPTLVEDGVYVGAKQQGVAWDIDRLDFRARGYTVLEHCVPSEPITFGTWDEMGVLGTLDGIGQAAGDVAREESVSQAALARQCTAGRHARYSGLRPDGRQLAVRKVPVCESRDEGILCRRIESVSVGLDKVVVVSTDHSRRQADGSSIPCPSRRRHAVSELRFRSSVRSRSHPSGLRRQQCRR